MSVITAGYLKEIPDVGWVQEIIMERFDNALEMLTENAVVYGGAVRDCLAGKELLGDLDIAVNAAEFKAVSIQFQENSKWVPADSSQPEMKSPPQGFFKLKSSGDMARALSPMSGICAFRTIGGQEVQLITSKQRSKDRLEDSIYVARMVDIVCCGVVMLHDGRVFEVLPGAHQDCIDGVLRLNEDSDTIFVDALPFRVKKLVGRGWQNNIDVDKALKEVKLRQDRAKRKAERNMASMHRKVVHTSSSKTMSLDKFPDVITNHNILGNGDEADVSPDGYTSEISPREMERYYNNDPKIVIQLLSRAAQERSINIRVKVAPTGRVFYVTKDGHDAGQVINSLHKWKREQLKKEKERVEYPSEPTVKAAKYAKAYGGTVTGRTSSIKFGYSGPRGLAKEVARPKRGLEAFEMPDPHAEMAESAMEKPWQPFGGIKMMDMDRTGPNTWVVTFRLAQGTGEMEKYVRVQLNGDQAKQLKGEWGRMSDDARRTMITRFLEISEGRH